MDVVVVYDNDLVNDELMFGYVYVLVDFLNIYFGFCRLRYLFFM